MAENMHISHVHVSLIRRPVMDSMPARWFVLNVFAWLFLTAFLVVQSSVYFVLLTVTGFMLARFLLQKAYAKDDIIFSVYTRHFTQEDHYAPTARVARKLEKIKS